MMSNNKILTVSYGTFSCTLEGFDDSFGTMKAIAEYFRGLSSDAPYFGAEPPQPDAEMLARIAQKEISRRVEAREHDGKIHLSAIENRSEEEATTPRALLSDGVDKDIATKVAAAVVVPAAFAETDNKDKDEVAPEADVKDATDELTSNAEPEISAEAVPEILPETLMEETVEAPQIEATPEAKDEADVAKDGATDAAKDAAVPDLVEDENDIVPGQPDADVEAFFANSSDVAVAEEEDQDVAEEQIALSSKSKNAPNDSIAAKLQRIRAVVAQHDDIDDEDDFVEDQHAEGAAEAATATEVEPDHLMADARRDIEDALDADEAEDAVMDSEDSAEEDDDDDIAAILGRLDAANAAESSEADEDIIAVSRASDETDDALNNLFGDDDGDDDEEDTLEVVFEHDEAAEILDDDEATQDEPHTPRARVIKVKRADLEAAIENGELEEYVDAQDENDIPSLDDLAPAKSAESSLSAADEAELARELADLEADMSPVEVSLADELDASDDIDDIDDEDDLNILDDRDEAAVFDDAASLDDDNEDEEDHEDLPAAASARRMLPSIDDAQGDDMDRLLAETDQQMDEPESATRRSAFSHLRAAVAAKKADVAMGAADEAEDDDNAYRSDLADVVRPRRPVSSATRTERPGEGRPAPLKLVAEQRIDVAQPRAAGPVRPRRVAAVSDAAQTAPEGESFADYAAEMGATKLPQLLEAAAAYMSFVEGREQFSRPQLMTKVRQVGPEEGFSREDGLRSFGQLLRAGKIEKIKGGRFTVSEDIGYRPDHRAAG